MATQPDMLQEEIARRTGQGWVLVSRDAAEAQMRKPKRFSILWFLAWTILSVGTLFWVYLIWHWAKTDQLIFLRVVQGQLVVSGGGRGGFGALFAPFGAWWRWAGERPSTQGKVLAYGGPIAGVVVLIIIISVAASAGGGGDGGGEQVAGQSTEAAPADSSGQEPAEPTQPPEPTDTPERSWETGPVTEATVREALKDADEAIRSEDLGDSRALFVDEALGSIRVVYKADSAIGETDLLSIGAQTSFSAMRSLFANPRVQTVTVTLLADWTDQFGSSKEEETTKSTIGRALVDSRIDWDGLEDRVYGDNKLFFCISEDYYIHPAIYVRLEDKGCLLQ